MMGIGQEPSTSDTDIDGLEDIKSDRDEEAEDKTVDDKELELELAGKPWPVASNSVVIHSSLLHLSCCYIVAHTICNVVNSICS